MLRTLTEVRLDVSPWCPAYPNTAVAVRALAAWQGVASRAPPVGLLEGTSIWRCSTDHLTRSRPPQRRPFHFQPIPVRPARGWAFSLPGLPKRTPMITNLKDLRERAVVS